MSIEYRYKCLTENKIIRQLLSETAPIPTVCATNSSHTVDWNTLVINKKKMTKADIGLSNIQDIKSNFSAVVPPSASNDVTQGYSTGSRWVDTTTNIVYTCTNNGAGVAIWSSKAASADLVDTNARITKSGDSSKYLEFTINGSNNTSTQLVTNQTANRIITFPDATTTLVGTNTTVTLTNKTLTNPIISTIINTGTLTLPTSTDTLVGRMTTDTLTNKTITASSNVVAASQLRTTGSDIVISGATAPVAGQVLTAINSTSANWQSPSVGALPYYFVSDTVTATTTSASYVLMTSMTSIPAAGTYWVTFSGSGRGSATAQTFIIAIYNGNSIVQNSERDFRPASTTNTVNFYTQAVVTMNGTDTVQVRWYSSASGTFTMNERSMILIKIG